MCSELVVCGVGKAVANIFNCLESYLAETNWTWTNHILNLLPEYEVQDKIENEKEIELIWK